MQSDSEWSVLSEEDRAEIQPRHSVAPPHSSDEWADVQTAQLSDVESIVSCSPSMTSSPEFKHNRDEDHFKLKSVPKVQRRVIAIDEDNIADDFVLQSQPSEIPAVNIEAELRQCQARIIELEAQIRSVQACSAAEILRADKLEAKVKQSEKKIRQLEQQNAKIIQDNTQLRNRVTKSRKRQSRQIKSKFGALGAKGHHRPSVPAKLRYRRGRTTHRTVFSRGRKG